MLTTETTKAYLSILREELVPATGCTEPIALAYAAARLRDILGVWPERIRAEVSGNIIKNVKSVVVPNTGGLKGISAAIAAGIAAGDAEKILQVISTVPSDRHGAIAAYCQDTLIEIVCADTPRMLDIRLTGWAGEHSACVHIANSHSNIVREEKNGEVLLEKPVTDSAEDSLTDKSVLNVADILEFANTAELGDIAPLLQRQIDCNTAIAAEGLKNNWGANIGSVLLVEYPGDIKTEAKAWAAAGSDARMSGCELPVVILSGRPYHLDPEINHGIDKLICECGAVLVTEDSVSDQVEKFPTTVLNQWTYHSRLYAAARYCCEHQDCDLVQLVSFGCGVDAITTDETQAILQAGGKLYTELKIDEITNLGAVRIRLRSLFAALDEQE